MDGVWLEIRFWPSPQVGVFVLIETPLGLMQQVLVAKRSDWLPFLTAHLAPLIAASTQSAGVELQRKIANAMIAYARHGEGCHVDRETGLSRIDLDTDRERRLIAQARQATPRLMAALRGRGLRRHAARRYRRGWAGNENPRPDASRRISIGKQADA